MSGTFTDAIYLCYSTNVKRKCKGFQRKVGDVITVTGDTTLDFDVPLSKSVLTESTFEVVGVVSSPDYYYFDAREVTTLGTGVLGTIFYAQESVFDLTNNMLFKYL